MAAQQLLVTLAKDTWTDLTSTDITSAATVIHRGGAEVILQAGDTGGGDEPISTDTKGLPIGTGRDGLGNGFLKKTLTDMFSVVTAPVRLYGRALGGTAVLFVEHD